MPTHASTEWGKSSWGGGACVFRTWVVGERGPWRAEATHRVDGAPASTGRGESSWGRRLAGASAGRAAPPLQARAPLPAPPPLHRAAPSQPPLSALRISNLEPPPTVWSAFSGSKASSAAARAPQQDYKSVEFGTKAAAAAPPPTFVSTFSGSNTSSAAAWRPAICARALRAAWARH